MKNIKTAFLFFVAVAVIVTVAPQATFALAVQDNDSNSVVNTLTTQNNDSLVGSIVIPQTQVNGLDVQVIVVPTTQSNEIVTPTIIVPLTQDNEIAPLKVSAPATKDNSASAVKIIVPATQDNSELVANVSTNNNSGGTTNSGGNTNNGGATSYTGSGSGYSSGNGGVVYNNPLDCALPVNHLKFGTSDSNVTRLQKFLMGQGFNVTITGTFDLQTKSAVEAFQVKYSSEILSPWGLSTPTGQVHITTIKKINSIACSIPLTLTNAELALINATKASVGLGEATAEEVFGSNTTGSTVASGTSTNTSQVAAVGEIGIFGKIWNSIKRIFGR